MKAIRSNSMKKQIDKKFIYYCIYAFGVPIFFTSITILVDLFENLPDILKPHIGKTICFYDLKAIWARILYFLLPISCQVISNVVFFGLTVNYYFKVKYNIMQMNDAQQKKGFMADKKTLITVLKLSLVMGLTWIAEIVSTFVKSNLFWQIFDYINSAQGILIFLIFLLKPRVLKSLRRLFTKNYPPFDSSDTNATNISTSKISGLSTERKDISEMSDFLNNKRKGSTEKGF